MRTWQMQEAKARISEVVKRAQTQGPQEITLHGKSVAVVISREAYDRISGNEHSLVDFMRRSPAFGLDELRFERDRNLTRKVVL